MLQSNKCKYLIALFFILNMLNVFSFEWPQEINDKGKIIREFGQKQGDKFNQSLVFAFPQEVYSAEKGKIILRMENDGTDSGWFISPLGNALIITHEANLLTTYGNLEEIRIDKAKTDVESHELLAFGGASGWQEGISSLEFQVADIEKKAAVNPEMLLPKLPLKNIVHVRNVIAVNKKGGQFELSKVKYLPAGSYYLYRDIDFMPFKTSVFVNGAAVETIQYDILLQMENKLCISGKRKYPLKEMYRGNEKQFLAEVVLSRGKNTISIIASDINGTERSALFTVDVN